MQKITAFKHYYNHTFFFIAVFLELMHIFLIPERGFEVKDLSWKYYWSSYIIGNIFNF